MELVTRILEHTLNWINAMMTATGYIWWGTIAACLVAYGVLLIMERIKALFKRRKDAKEPVYFNHDYNKPISRIIRSEQYDTKDGINFYSMNLEDLDRRLGNDGNSRR